MSARSRARKRALDVLFEADVRGADPIEVLAQTEARRSADGSTPLHPYAADLVRGVAAHRGQIDELLSTYAQGWTLERMPPVDRNVLRIGAYELLWRDDIPDAVAMDEAVQLARDLSTDDSPAFVNGLLARLHRLRETFDITTGDMTTGADAG